MATRYDVIRRPGVQLIQEEPMSALDSLASALGDYYSPEEIRARKADRRADARVRLEQDRFDELKEQTDFNQEQTRIANRRQAALDERQTLVFNQGQEDRKFNRAKEDFDLALAPLLETGDMEGAIEFLDSYTTDNPRLSAIAKQREKNLNRRNSQLNSAVTALETLAPGLSDKFSASTLKSMLFRDPNAIANQIMLGEIGQITKGKEREYEARKTILAGQLDQLKTAVAGTEAYNNLVNDIETTMSGIREYGGIGISGGGGEDPLGDITDLIGNENLDLEEPDFFETLTAVFSPEKREGLEKKVSSPKYALSKVSKDIKDIETFAKRYIRPGTESEVGMSLAGSTIGRRDYDRTMMQRLKAKKSDLKDYVSQFYHPSEGFLNDELRKEFREKYKGRSYDKYLIPFFDSLWETKTLNLDILGGNE
tara:strand:+ start:341 stop:1615 length:1275 start_codon:yes stop_codon:yes gene_type:complete